MKWRKILFFTSKPSSRLYHYFFSYILIGIVVLFSFGGIVYRNITRTVSIDVEKTFVSSVVQAKNSVETHIREMKRMVVEVASNPNLTPYTVSSEGHGSVVTIRELLDYTITNEFIYDLLLYYNRGSSQKIYSGVNGSMDLSTFFDTVYHFESLNCNDFISMMDSMKAPVFRPIENVWKDQSTFVQLAAYIYPLPLHTNKPYGTVMFLIQKQSFQSLFANILDYYNGFIYIMDEKGHTIVSMSHDHNDETEENVMSNLTIQELDEGSNILLINDVEYTVIKVISQENQWTYLAVVPKPQYLSKVYESRKVFNNAIVVAFVLGIAGAAAFSINNYRILRVMVDSIKKHMDGQYTESQKDEIEYITQSIINVSEKFNSIHDTLENTRKLVKEQVLVSLLKGKWFSTQEFSEKTEMSRLVFDKPLYVVLFFVIDNLFRAENMQKSYYDAVRFGVINVLEELSHDVGYGYGVEMFDEKCIALIVNLKEMNNAYDRIMGIANRSIEFFKQHFGFAITVGVGNIYHTISMVHLSFLEARRATEYRILFGESGVILFKNLNDSVYRYQYPLEKEKQLIKTIKGGDSNEIEVIVNDTINELRNQIISPEAVQCICYGMVNAITVALEELNIQIDDTINKQFSQILSGKFTGLEDFRAGVLKLGMQVCLIVEENKESKNLKLRDDVIEFIDVHYLDSSLSLQTIADRFNRTPSYITRYFKNQTGFSLMHYIDKVRMEKAKELLKSTRLSLTEIVEKVGYVDKNNFSRKFKSHEGMTPMQYRNTL